MHPVTDISGKQEDLFNIDLFARLSFYVMNQIGLAW